MEKFNILISYAPEDDADLCAYFNSLIGTSAEAFGLSGTIISIVSLYPSQFSAAVNALVTVSPAN